MFAKCFNVSKTPRFYLPNRASLATLPGAILLQIVKIVNLLL